MEGNSESLQQHGSVVLRSLVVCKGCAYLREKHAYEGGHCLIDLTRQILKEGNQDSHDSHSGLFLIRFRVDHKDSLDKLDRQLKVRLGLTFTYR